MNNTTEINKELLEICKMIVAEQESLNSCETLGELASEIQFIINKATIAITNAS